MGDRRSFAKQKGFDAYQQVFPLPGSSIMDEGFYAKVRWGSLGRLYKEDHLGQGLQPDFHPLLRRLYRFDSKFSGTFINPDCNPFLPFLMINQGGYVFSPRRLLVLYLPVIFFIPFMLFLKISFFLPMSLLSSRLFCFRFSLSISFSALLISSLPFVVLSNQFVEGGSDVEESQALHGSACSSLDHILGLQRCRLGQRCF